MRCVAKVAIYGDGLHCTPASKLCGALFDGAFRCDVRAELIEQVCMVDGARIKLKPEPPVFCDGKSILQLMSLGARTGAVLTFTFEGDDAAEAMRTLEDACNAESREDEPRFGAFEVIEKA